MLCGDRFMSAFDRRVDPEVREVRRLEVITGALGRRRWSTEAKGRIVAGRARWCGRAASARGRWQATASAIPSGWDLHGGWAVRNPTPTVRGARGSMRRLRRAHQAQLRPDGRQRADQVVDVRIGMERRRCDAQPLSASRYRRIIDWLHVDAVLLEEQIADPLA